MTKRTNRPHYIIHSLVTLRIRPAEINASLLSLHSGKYDLCLHFQRSIFDVRKRKEVVFFFRREPGWWNTTLRILRFSRHFSFPEIYNNRSLRIIEYCFHGFSFPFSFSSRFSKRTAPPMLREFGSRHIFRVERNF